MGIMMKKTKHRSISEILIQCDSTDDLKVIDKCCDEIISNKRNYPLVQLEFAKEHITELIKELARQDAKMMNEFFNDLFNR